MYNQGVKKKKQVLYMYCQTVTTHIVSTVPLSPRSVMER
jgi:hypothetical protein